MKILVTGCTGFVGSNLVDLLLDRGHQVYCASRQKACSHDSRSLHLQCDLSQLNNYDFPCDLDCVIHCAAIMNKDANCHDIFLSNVLGTLNLLEYGKRSRIRKFIFLSSGAVYGYAPYPLSEEHQPRPLDFYGLSKYEAELLVKNYARDFSTVTMRLFYPYGPGQRKGVIHSLTRKILNGEKILLYNNDHPQITPIYITDLVEIIYFSLIKLEGDSLFNVSGEEIASIKDISLLIAKYLGPSPVFEKVTDKRISNQIGVNSKMKQYLDYKLKTRLQEGILSYVRSLSLKRPSSL